MKYVITFRYYETYNEKLIVEAKDVGEVKAIYNKMYQSNNLDDVEADFLEDTRLDKVEDIEIEKCQP